MQIIGVIAENFMVSAIIQPYGQFLTVYSQRKRQHKKIRKTNI
jgi:hypothetical protein